MPLRSAVNAAQRVFRFGSGDLLVGKATIELADLKVDLFRGLTWPSLSAVRLRSVDGPFEIPLINQRRIAFSPAKRRTVQMPLLGNSTAEISFSRRFLTGADAPFACGTMGRQFGGEAKPRGVCGECGVS